MQIYIVKVNDKAIYREEECNLFINLTPHEVRIIKPDGVLVIPPGDTVARCEQSVECVGELEGVPVMRLVMGELSWLPPAKPDVIYIVSHIVLQKAAGRHDLVKPGELVRDEKGSIIGCRGFCCL